MGDIRTERRQQYMEEIPYDMLQHHIDSPAQAVKNVEKDILGYGIISGGAVSATAPASMSVSIAAILAYSSLGDHLKTIAAQEVDCSEDYAGDPTVPESGNMWISIFALPDWTDGDERPNGVGTIVAHTRTEAVEFRVYKGTATLLPSNPGSGAIRVCSIKLTSATTTITAGIIYTSSAYRDTLAVLSDRLKKTGDNLTGTLTYDGRPLLFSNKGTVSMPANMSQITGLSNDDFDNHFVLAGPMIDTKITGKHLAVLCSPKINMYHAGAVIPLWLNPIRMRWHSDLMAAGNTLTEGIFVYQEVDSNDQFTGNIQIIILGAQHFVSRFVNRPIRWVAIAPMPVSIG